jgi:hypothetical protein
MAKKKRQPGSKDMASWKPGSEAEEAKNVGGTTDFGVPAGSEPSRAREYTSDNTKASDPGAAMPRSGEEAEGVRTSGAGAADEGVGSGSGGDIDTDILGVGTGGSGISATGPDHPPGPDDSDGTSREMASGPPAKGENQTGVGTIGGGGRVKGTTHSGEIDVTTGALPEGSDAATNPAARGDDSFAGEVSSGEAAGEDPSAAPSQETQGLSQEDDQTGP